MLKFIMQVGPAGATGVPQVPDHIAPLDPFSLGHESPAEMRIARYPAFGMANLNHLTMRTGPTRAGDHTASGGQYGAAVTCDQVYAFMHGAKSVEGVAAHAKSAGYFEIDFKGQSNR